MPTQDTSQIKGSIISFLKMNGPSLPVHIAGKIENSILFTSAFLSELLSEKRVRISNMRVGNSPLYYLEGQEPKLEKFAQYLKSKEKEAFLLLKEKKFLKDSVQQPAIRVALREIRDFAVPFRRDAGEEKEIWWRYFTVPESELRMPAEKEKQTREEKAVPKDAPKEKELGIFDKTPEPARPKEKEKKPAQRKKSRPARKKKTGTNEKLFNSVKEFMAKNSIKLKDISGFSKSEVVLLVEDGGREKVLVAFSKNKIGEKEISAASKKSRELGLPYMIVSKSGILKKLESLIEDLKQMDSMKSLSD